MHTATWMTTLTFVITLAACSSGGGNTATGTGGTGATGGGPSGSASSTGNGGAITVGSGGATGSGGSAPCGMAEGQPCCNGQCGPGMACMPLGAPDSHAICVCDFNQCPTYSWGCVGNTEVYCHADAPGQCPVPIESHPCPSGMDCSPATGTCGGCDPHDECFGHADGEFLTCGFGGVAYTCKLDKDGCVKRVAEQCGISCVGGAHTGCCGGQGQMCCSPPGAPCVDGLSCQNGACAP